MIDTQTTFARTLVDEWVRAGVTEVCLAPGSRSTPLALACAERLRTHVLVDERSASYFAIGLGKASGRPAILVSTSGTATAHFHGAVVEADRAGVPLIVCTADRPPELRDTGAPQTIDQNRIYGSATRWYCEPGVADDRGDPVSAGRFWRSIGARSVIEAAGADPGPVHFQLAFREPFVPEQDDLPMPPGRPDDMPWVTMSVHRAPAPEAVAELIGFVEAHERGVIIVGDGALVSPATIEAFAEASGWPVLADAISNARGGAYVVDAYEALLRCEQWASAHRPTAAVRFGAALTSKLATGWLDASVEQLAVTTTPRWLDPHRTVARYLIAPAEGLIGTALQFVEPREETTWREDWTGAGRRARAAIDDLLDSWDEPFEGRIARDVATAVPSGGALVVGSSMPVRDLEWFAPPRPGILTLSNRGANGIDGLVSTTLGVAAAWPQPTVGLMGDLSFLHDHNGLIGATGRAGDATLVVVDNDGGGIFSFLPQVDHPRFEQLFGTPHGLDLGAIGEVHGLTVSEPESAAEVAAVVAKATAMAGVNLVVIRTDRHTNVDRHRAVWHAAEHALLT